MSNEIIDCVAQVVCDLEKEVGSLEDVIPPSSFNLEPCSTEDLMNVKEKRFAAAVQGVSQLSTVKIHLEEQKSKLMVDTLTEELNSLERLNSLIKQPNISRLTEFASLDERVDDIESVDQDLGLLKSVQKQAKEQLNEILRRLFPDLREEIREVLSRIEEDSRQNLNDVSRAWSPRLCPALELLTRATVIQQTEPNLYNFNSEM